MLYVYRRASSTSARSLSEALDGIRIRNDERLRRRVRRGDNIIMWGEHLDLTIAGVRLLNNVPIQNKFEDAQRLRAAGVSTIETSRTRPVQAPATPPPDPLVDLWDDAVDLADAFAGTAPGRTQVARDGLAEIITSLQALQRAQLVAPPTATATVALNWIPRLFNHTGGNDLLTPPNQPDFFVKKESFVNEYRIHSFLGKSIRAGKKAPREGFATPHAWIRSWDGGWRILYDGVTPKQRHRDIAHEAVAALGLQFGAVDIGERADNSLVVLEVNRAPGLEGGTVDAYARAIQGWTNDAQ